MLQNYGYQQQEVSGQKFDPETQELYIFAALNDSVLPS